MKYLLGIVLLLPWYVRTMETPRSLNAIVQDTRAVIEHIKILDDFINPSSARMYTTDAIDISTAETDKVSRLFNELIFHPDMIKYGDITFPVLKEILILFKLEQELVPFLAPCLMFGN